MAALTVGVLGGMGPDATLDFFSKLLAASPASSDQERLRVLIDSNPRVPNRNEAVAGRGPSPAPVLVEMARGLERSGADFLVMPCNAAHAWADEIAAAVAIPLVNIIAETVDETLRRFPGLERAGILAAAGCLDARLYDDALAQRGVSALVPRQAARERFMELLYRIKSGERLDGARREMRALADDLLAEGAQAIVAGCTEVPLVLAQEDLPCPFIDSSDVLARAAVAYAHGERLFEPRPVNP